MKAPRERVGADGERVSGQKVRAGECRRGRLLVSQAARARGDKSSRVPIASAFRTVIKRWQHRRERRETATGPVGVHAGLERRLSAWAVS